MKMSSKHLIEGYGLRHVSSIDQQVRWIARLFVQSLFGLSGDVSEIDLAEDSSNDCQGPNQLDRALGKRLQRFLPRERLNCG